VEIDVYEPSAVEVSVAGVDPQEVGRRRQRLLGSVGGDEAGPTVVCCAALHGDEPSGVLALGRVFDELERRRPSLRGEVVGIAGNLAALVESRRFIAADLNRHWLAENLERARQAAAVELADEDRELRELLDTLHEVFGRARAEVYFLDLHTSSAAGDPFVCVGDTLRNRAFAEQFRMPVILGLEECIDGSLLEYVNDLGHVTIGVEAGQHRADSSVDRHESFVWLALVAAGVVSAADVPDLEGHRRRLHDASHRLDRFLEVRHRHPIVAADEFEMVTGFSNFQSVAAGELLAHDRSGEIRAPESGRILLPLYQGLGSDGYFIAREVRSFWLRLSAALRWLGLDSVLHWLPGVRRHPEREATLIIDTGLARWFALELFHLLGYRKRRSENGKLVISRRRFDHHPPAAAHEGAITR
jgi:succinylglutamate desuccinylase